EGVALRLEIRGMVAAERAVRELLHHAERDRALRREQRGRLTSLVQRRVVDAVDEPDAQRLLRADDTSGEDQLLCDAEAAHACEPLRPAPAGDAPQVDLGLPELRPAPGIPNVARQRELAASAEREAVDRGDGRLRHRLEQVSGLM